MEIRDFKDYIPLDKSWMIRMGVLDVLNNYFDIISFLHTQREDFLGDDLKALREACRAWNSNYSIDIGESGTLYRFLQFASWKSDLKKEFIKKGTLKDRPICNDPSIVKLPLEELLKLDDGTSQWASASVLSGNSQRLEDVPYKLKLSYEAVDHWNSQRNQDKVWEPKHDKTIEYQALSFMELASLGKMLPFFPSHSEDYCFARAFGWTLKEEGAKRFPSLKGHESNRLEYMENYLDKLNSGEEIDSKDHRVIQSIAMLAKSQKKDVNFTHPESVNKSWPQFWDFLKVAHLLKSPYVPKG